MSTKTYTPKAVFDSLNDLLDQHKTIYAADNPRQLIDQWLNHCLGDTPIPDYAAHDYQYALNFLYSYRGSPDTFNAYRRDIERLLQWSWFVREQSVKQHTRDDIEAFIHFCIKPPKRWIGVKTVARFKRVGGQKSPNPEWHPFDVRISKADHQAGLSPDKDNYQYSQSALKTGFNILSSFYSYLLQEEVVNANPVALIRQKSKFIRKQASAPSIRRLSEQQWQAVIHLAKEKAAQTPAEERTVFILSCLFGMYLRISELAATEQWTPTMGDFIKDNEGNWWFNTVGKGNKARKIAVSDAMLSALAHYRESYLNLSPYPQLGETTPLISHVRNPLQSISHTRQLRRLVQQCFDAAIAHFEAAGNAEEADSLRGATVHWLRHTGISEDVKHRPREHVRDDAGHSSGAITDRYIDVELMARAKSAKYKAIDDGAN